MMTNLATTSLLRIGFIVHKDHRNKINEVISTPKAIYWQTPIHGIYSYNWSLQKGLFNCMYLICECDIIWSLYMHKIALWLSIIWVAGAISGQTWPFGKAIRSTRSQISTNIAVGVEMTSFVLLMFSFRLWSVLKSKTCQIFFTFHVRTQYCT